MSREETVNVSQKHRWYVSTPEWGAGSAFFHKLVDTAPALVPRCRDRRVPRRGMIGLVGIRRDDRRGPPRIGAIFRFCQKNENRDRTSRLNILGGGLHS